MSRPALCLPFLALFVCLSAGETAAAWPEDAYNPKRHKQPDDLVLPMPCGGAMVFRPVAVAVTGPYGEAEVDLGNSDSNYAYAEGSRRVFLSGAFEDKSQPNRRLYYLGKTEVTQWQWDAVQGNCTTVFKVKDRLPKLRVTWAEAVTFATSYSQWLVANAADLLPKADGLPGFVRLPTEGEWEYAARGGLAVRADAFNKPLFPMPGAKSGKGDKQVQSYAWFAGPSSSKGKPRPVGVKLPNPLGLLDMIGNAEEIILEPYRLNHLGRPHGQPGGFVVKGGSFLTAKAALRSAYRQEVPPFRDGEVNRSKTVGLRLVISAVVLTTRERHDILRAAFDQLARPVADAPVDDGLPLAAQKEDPIEEIKTLIEAATDEEFKSRLSDISLIIKTNIVSRNRQRDMAARSFIRNGVFMADKIRRDIKSVEKVNKAFNMMKSASASAPAIKKISQRLEVMGAELGSTIDFYMDFLARTSKSTAISVLKAQLLVYKVELGEQLKGKAASRSIEETLVLAGKFVEHVSSYSRRKGVDRDVILEDFTR